MRVFFLILLMPLIAWTEDHQEALFLRRIADFWQEGEYQLAKTQIEEFIVEYPESPFADALCAALGDLFLREKNFSNALNYYSQIQAPEFVQKVFLNRMQCLYEMQWYATLADECEAYLATHPDVQVTYFLAIALYHQCMNASRETGQVQEIAERAKPYFENLYAGELSDEIAQGYAHLLCILKEYTKATEVYRDLAENKPENREEMLFQLALIQSEYDKSLALTTFEQIVDLRGRRSKEAAYNRMIIAFELGRYEDLVSGKILTQVPESRLGLARLFLGRSLLQLKRYEEAARELKAYIEEAPISETLFAALISLLDASYQIDDLATLDGAIDRLKQTYPETCELPKAYFSRAQIFKRCEMFEEAKLELEKLLSSYPSFAQKAQVLFELAHLDYKSKLWESCYKKSLQFLTEFSQHELTPFIWRYFVSASAEIALQNSGHKEQFLTDLKTFLELPLTDLEKNDWQLLIAKTYYELQRYPEAISYLKTLATPNARLLLSLCCRDANADMQTFCNLAEEALKNGANLVDKGQIHASLYNAFLDLSNLDKAAQHLYEAFMAKVELRKDNLLWLADYYFERLRDDPEDFLLAARTASLFNKCKSALHPKDDEPLLDSVICKLAKVYSILGRIDDAVALLESSLTIVARNQEAKLLLAENYQKKGNLDQALQMFDEIVVSFGTGRDPVAAAAALQGAKIKRSQNSLNSAEVAMQLKNLILQKNFEGEPVYLEAALEYVELSGKADPAKRKSLLEKTKLDFEQKEDILSKDYHAAREKSVRKNITYQGYMKLIDAEILLAEAQIDLRHQNELKKSSKALLQQIIEDPVALCLKERVQKLLADET